MIYVIGGDGCDAQIGIDLLARMGIAAQGLPISNSPSDYRDILARVPLIDDYILEKLRPIQADVFLVFCNTLSFSVDWDRLANKIRTPILSLSLVYNDFLAQYSSVGVVACFEDTINNIRLFCDQNNRTTTTLSYAMVSLVEAVENNEPFVEDILHQLIETSAHLKAEAFVLGCTHFEDCDLARSPIDVIYPGKRLIQYALNNGYIPAQYRMVAQ